MRMKERKNGEVVVIGLTGDVMNDDAMDRFLHRVDRLKKEGQNKMVIDLGDVRLINSVGVGMLAGAMTSMRNADGDMKLANLSDRAYAILVVISWLHQVFDIHATVEEAVASFAMSPTTA